MFRTEDTYVNRYGDEYYVKPINENQYLFVMEGDSMKWCRYGGKEGQEVINTNDLGMFDPSGGPYITLGMEIDGKKISRIADAGPEGIMLEVEDD